MTEPALPTPAGDTDPDLLVIPVGLRRPFPTSGAELASLLRDLLVHLGVERRLADMMSVEAELDGTDITRLAFTVPDVAVANFDEPTDDLPRGHLDEMAARVGVLDVRADAVRWEKAEFHGSVHAEGIGLTWLLSQGDLAGIRFDNGASQVRGTLQLDTDLASLAESFRLTLNRQLAEHGARIRKLKAQASQLGERVYRVSGEAAVRWKSLPASARLSLVATIDADLTLRFSDVQVSSRNPIVAVVLAFNRRRLLASFAEPVALREAVGSELVDFTLRLEPRLVVEASFAELR